MRHVSTAFAACCLAVAVVGLASVQPAAGQETAVGTERFQSDRRTPLLVGTRFRVASTSAPWETWGPGGEPPLTESCGAGPHACREVQLESGRRVRSKTRTTVGAVLMVAGGLASYAAYFLCGVGGADAALYTGKYVGPVDSRLMGYGDDGCVLEPHRDWRHDVFTEHAPNYRVVAGGAGVMALGVLLTTVWADVVEVRRGQSGVEVAMSIRSR